MITSTEMTSSSNDSPGRSQFFIQRCSPKLASSKKMDERFSRIEIWSKRDSHQSDFGWRFRGLRPRGTLFKFSIFSRARFCRQTTPFSRPGRRPTRHDEFKLFRLHEHDSFAVKSKHVGVLRILLHSRPHAGAGRGYRGIRFRERNFNTKTSQHLVEQWKHTRETSF